MKILGAQLVAISPELPDYALLAVEKNKLTFPVLSDAGNQVARQFGLVFRVGQAVLDLSRQAFNSDFAPHNGDQSYELPVPATFVLDRGGEIRFAHISADYMTGRAEPGTVIDVLKTL